MTVIDKRMENFGSKVFAAWRDAAGASWIDYVDHPFVRGLGDGSLKRSAYIAYLIQDYIFLLHFSRAWALAVVKSDTPDQMRSAAATVNALINEEIQLHVAVCAREGITEQHLLQATEEPENLAYTRYVMDAGLSGDLLDLLATLAPCVFGYAEIGYRLSQCHDTTPLYREWIDTYHSDDYKLVCISVATLIEQVTFAKLGNQPEDNPRWPVLCQRFEKATQLEAGFWSMGIRLGDVG
jgi:thiaminase/transcriptional activator TenA